MKLLSLLFLLSAGVSVWAQSSPVSNMHAKAKEYHVSVRGSDAGNGSLATPFRTISAAAQMAMPGDVITVHAGVYREQVIPPEGREFRDGKNSLPGSQRREGRDQRFRTHYWVEKAGKRYLGGKNSEQLFRNL